MLPVPLLSTVPNGEYARIYNCFGQSFGDYPVSFRGWMNRVNEE